MSNRVPNVGLRRAGWFKSSFSSSSSQCVEVKFEGDLVSIRDSKYRRDPANDLTQEPIITVNARQWTTLLDVLTGRATVGANGALTMEAFPDGATRLRAPDSGMALSYTPAEWQMFLAGVRAHEFDHPALATPRHSG
ncbi:MAG: DUF397 domain-containing protein [Haloechinothrix sp.]